MGQGCLGSPTSINMDFAQNHQEGGSKVVAIFHKGTWVSSRGNGIIEEGVVKCRGVHQEPRLEASPRLGGKGVQGKGKVWLWGRILLLCRGLSSFQV